MIYPIFAMFLLTLVVGIVLGRARFKAVATRDIDRRYFLVNSGYQVPQKLAQMERNFSNLFETPPLFYVVCLASLALNVETTAMLIMAWVYVGLRVLHSFIHITYNNVYHRFMAFISSLLVILSLWVLLLIQLNS